MSFSTGTIYTLTNIVNGKIYVGLTTVSLKKRLIQHRSAVNRGSNYAIHNAIRKYGWESFETAYLKVPVKYITGFEEQLIRSLGTMTPNGYNLTSGGEGTAGRKVSNKVRAEHSQRMRGRFTGENNPFYGKKHSIESKSRISEANSGKLAWNRGKRLHYSVWNVGGSHRPGVPRYQRAIVLIHPDGTLEEFKSIKKACLKYELSAGSLGEVLRGEKRKQHKGFKAKYKEDL